jgi:hypothetical protein
MTSLTENFALDEFLVSQTAERMGRPIEANARVIANLRYLCENVMQPIRDALQAEFGPDLRILVSSGYRPVWLNRKIGGSKTSSHCCGDKSRLSEAACDWRTIGADATLLEICQFIVQINGDEIIPFDQLIYEGTWIHTGWRANPNNGRGEVLTATFSRKWGRKVTTYHQGLI